jgi:hypothetical protein
VQNVPTTIARDIGALFLAQPEPFCHPLAAVKTIGQTTNVVRTALNLAEAYQILNLS